MKLTSKGRYAVMAMADLAKNKVKVPTSLTEISLRQGISIAYLEQLFLKLRKRINFKYRSLFERKNCSTLILNFKNRSTQARFFNTC